jgi:hypothetical protein
MSLKDFVSYVLEAVEFFLSGVRFRHKNDELIIIDSFFIISSIQKSKVFQDRYFSKLVDSLNKAGKNYAYLPCFDGIKKRSTIYRIFKILKKYSVPVLSEYQLLSFMDYLRIFYFIITYPLHIFKLIRNVKPVGHEEKLLIHELIDTLDQVSFRNFSRYLQGIKIAKLPYKNIKVISWYENQVINKNLYKGLRTNKQKVKIYGAQLLLYSRNILNIAADETEADFGLLPDKILVNGPSYVPKNTRLNYSVGPSIRYSEIFNGSMDNGKRENILILLPYFKDYARNILKVVNKVRFNNQKVIVKLHPSLNMQEFAPLLPKNAILTQDDIYNLFKNTKVLISSASGTLVEAISIGIPAISIRDKGMINFSPLPDYGRGIVWEEVNTAEGLEECLHKFEYELNNEIPKIKDICSVYKKDFFCEPTEKKIIESFELA